jgi:Ca-activated chloride channel homolog
MFGWANVPRFSLECLLLAAMVHSLGAQPLTEAAYRADSQMVLVPVTVTDHNGKTVEGLGSGDFNILDDQRPQRIVSFTNEDAPCSVGVVLDISGSMRNILGTAKDVAHAFFQTANPDDEYLLLTVSTQPEAVSGFTTDIPALEDSVDLARSGGATALIDTVYLGLSRMRGARRPRRALLIVSDGLDNHSRYSKAELMRVALEADVQVYSVIVDNPLATASSNTIPFRPAMVRKPSDQGEEHQGPQMLEELSDRTGGLHFHVRNGAEAKEAVIKAGRALRSQYVIGYQLPDSGSSGKWHRVRVKSTVQKVNVYARNGYYEP